ncbi:MAG TPA: 3-oxoacyl-[acyl-carrier-protein] synthase III C-terminal domain-containing protein [Candidatus Angelobacter sp.]|jgi:3-oxoacyl-[acyl-carrier-protein] synthase-3|nr:3-oxoacyl-[acyl-carrier-protein] synthase III C-terminal domain-containing protein [Candidatus Angelobacter sp.]
MKPGIEAIEYVLPSERHSLQEMADAGLLTSTPEQLKSFGFESCYIGTVSAEELALAAATQLMERHQVVPESIELLLYAGAISPSHQIGNGHFLSSFNYPAAMLQYELGLARAAAIGISQTGCMGLTYAVKFAVDFLHANPEAQRVLCVSADVLPKGAAREILFNVISDGACALMVERRARQNQILAHRSVTKGYYWHCMDRKNEIMAAYFPTAKNLVEDLLQQAKCDAGELRLLLPHNVSLRSWEILLDLIGLKREQLFARNIAQNGHVIAADNWINLKDAIDSGLLNRGDKFLLFNFGFGAHWAATLMEY